VPDGVVTIDTSGQISAIEAYTGQAVDEDLWPSVLLPGFVDAHVHFPQTRIVGAATGPLLDWLARSTFPEEARFAQPSHAERVASVFATSLAAAGTTLSFVYGSVHAAASDALLSALAARGQRAVVGPVWMNSGGPPELMVDTAATIDGVEGLVERWHGHDAGRLQVAVIPRFALSCTADMMKAAGELARRHDLWVSTHLSENREECRVAIELFGTADYLAVYEDAGLLHDRSLYAHCIHLSASEWDRFAAAGAVVAHCPDSNFFLGSGGMPVNELLQRGIPVAMGSDIAAGRSFRISRALSSAYDNALLTGASRTPAELLWWGTRGGALALGQPQVGAIQVGLEADLVCLDLPDWVEQLDEALGWILFDHDAPRPRKTWVRGRVVWDRSQAGAGYLG